MQEYETLYFDEDVHISTVFNCTVDRQRFLKELRLDFPVDMLHFDPGSGVGATVFIWKVPENRSPVEMMKSFTKMYKSLENRIPEYHTKFMRQTFAKTVKSRFWKTRPRYFIRSAWKKSIVATGSVISALDHDVQQKGSLTQFVCLLVDIPEKVDDTFQRGQVFVTLIDYIKFSMATCHRANGNS